MLWKAQFLLEFYVIFCVYHNKIRDQKGHQKVRIFLLILAIIQNENNLIFQPLNYARLQKVQYLLNETSDLYEILCIGS